MAKNILFTDETETVLCIAVIFHSTTLRFELENKRFEPRVDEEKLQELGENALSMYIC